jgi:hypothetical protein
MVERLHQLKAALKSQANSPQWIDGLVLLGIRTARKEDLKCTMAKMVYGTTLRLPGEFFNTAWNQATADPVDYVARLKANMQQLHAPPVRKNMPPGKVFQSQALSSCTHVFVRHDATRRPLQPVYDGPFKVIVRKDKHFVLNRNGRTDTVSIDRLKPAHLDVSTPHVTTSTTPCTTVTKQPSLPPNPPPTRITRSGRQVRWRDRLDL